MSRRLRIVALIGAVALLGLVFVEVGIVPTPGGADRATVEIVGADDEQKATVDAEVAETWREQYTGLSDHERLEPGEGMLFVHSREGDRTYVMRGMDFGVDILFVDDEGSITTIHEAPAPGPDEDGSDQTYEGRAKWVLEVPYGYAETHGIEVGDQLVIEYE